MSEQDSGVSHVVHRATAASASSAKILAPSDIVEIIEGFRAGLTSTLKQLSPPTGSLIWPAQVLIYFGGIIVCISIVLRALPHFYSVLQFSFGDFLACLIVGTLLLLTGVFLFVYQFRAERLNAVAVVQTVAQTTTDVATGLVASLGPGKPRVGTA